MRARAANSDVPRCPRDDRRASRPFAHAASGETDSQAIAYDRNRTRRNNLSGLIAAGSLYGLTKDEANNIVARIEDAIRGHWAEAAEFGMLTSPDSRLLWGRQFLNPGTLYGVRDR